MVNEKRKIVAEERMNPQKGRKGEKALKAWFKGGAHLPGP